MPITRHIVSKIDFTTWFTYILHEVKAFQFVKLLSMLAIECFWHFGAGTNCDAQLAMVTLLPVQWFLHFLFHCKNNVIEKGVENIAW